MERNSPEVNRKRSYDSSRRQAQALRTRQDILAVARRLFLADGVAMTTIATVAAEAGASVDTIYKSFGGKPGLVRAICEQALAGDGPTPAETRSDVLHDSKRDPHDIIRGWGKLTGEVAPLIAPILLLIRDVAVTDPEMAAVQADMDTQRLQRMTLNARNLAHAGHLRNDLSVESAGEILWTYSSPQLYELLIVIRHWTLDAYTSFITNALIAALLPQQPSSARRQR